MKGLPASLLRVAAVGDAEDGDRRDVQPLPGQAGAAPGRPGLPPHRAGEEQGLRGVPQAHEGELGEKDAKALVDLSGGGNFDAHTADDLLPVKWGTPRS